MGLYLQLNEKIQKTQKDKKKHEDIKNGQGEREMRKETKKLKEDKFVFFLPIHICVVAKKIPQ
jgi:hypothetical protein